MDALDATRDRAEKLEDRIVDVAWHREEVLTAVRSAISHLRAGRTESALAALEGATAPLPIHPNAVPSRSCRRCKGASVRSLCGACTP